VTTRRDFLGEKGFTYHSTTGQLESIVSANGPTVSWTYDGALADTMSWSGVVAGTVTHMYDERFRLASQSVNGAHAVSYDYDGDGFVVTVGDLGIARDPDTAAVVSTTLGAAATAATYTEYGELASLSASNGTSELLALQYAVRDALGRITAKTETVGGQTDTYEYGYDSAGRLEEVYTNGVLSSSYTYDPNGNKRQPSLPLEPRWHGCCPIRRAGPSR
jgi:YD repeat-containing protein